MPYTYNELIDSVKVWYKFEAMNRGAPYYEVKNSVYLKWINDVESEIQRRALILADRDKFSVISTDGKIYEDWNELPYVDEGDVYYIGNGETVLGLSSVIAKDIHVSYYGKPLKYLAEKEYEELVQSRSDKMGGNFQYYTKWYQGRNWVYKIYPRQFDDISAEDYIDIAYYSTVEPSEAATFNFNSALLLPVEYYQLIEAGVQARIFHDFMPEYNRQLNLIREYRQSTPLEQLPGSNLGC